MYRLNAVHIETATLPNKRRDCFANRLAKAIKMSNCTSNGEFAKLVQNKIKEAGLEHVVKFTYQDIYGVMNHGIQLKANKVGALTLATHLPREYWEDFSRTPAQILKASGIMKTKKK